MVTKIVSTNRVIILFVIIALSFISCRTLTIQEFNEKYDAIEVDGEKTNQLISGSSIFSFSYNNAIYKVNLSSPPYLPIGRKYKILIDKEKPDKNYIILLSKPICLDTFPIVEGQIFITDSYKGKNEVWVSYELINFGDEGQYMINNGSQFFEDVKYYDVIKKYKEESAKVVIDAYLLEQLSDNKSRVVFKINYKKTDELNGYDYQ